jgi:hypothetical protein
VEVPPATFRLSDLYSSGGLISWEPGHFGAISGNWSVSFAKRVDGQFGQLATLDLNTYSVQAFWPLEYLPSNESAQLGGWKFTGPRSVPESGLTALYLAISVVALAVWPAYSRSESRRGSP